ncbi:MAG: glutathione peroxidase, partial [Myxococcales bacterium]|nr:glutathione peroxidase [Myxococcales bacterium]
MLDKAKKAITKTVTRAAYGAPPEGGPESLEGIGLTGLDGAPLDPGAIAGKVVLFVNVASRCGLTPQYAQLVELQQRYADRGFT